MKHLHKQSGVVSLFTVLFTTILLTVLTVGFMRIMVQEQRQAINNDLSQSAYDSAMSGVEDAKRALRACRLGSAAACASVDANACSTIQNAGIVGSTTDTEVKIKSGDLTDTSLSQSYTCVKVERNSLDVQGNLAVNDSQIVPLRAVGDFNQVVVEWTHKGSQYAGGNVESISGPADPSLKTLPPNTDTGWGKQAPALLRAQTVLPPSATQVTLAELDTEVASTVFLRPKVLADPVTVPTIGLGLSRASRTDLDTAAKEPSPVGCSNSVYQNGGYACKAVLQMPSGTVPAGSQVAFIRLTSLYNETSFRVTLLNATGNSIQFSDVQPVVDSTGRAGNLYRRVVSRLSYQDATGTALPSPNATIDITSSMCKDFYITDQVSSGTACPRWTPTP